MRQKLKPNRRQFMAVLGLSGGAVAFPSISHPWHDFFQQNHVGLYVLDTRVPGAAQAIGQPVMTTPVARLNGEASHVWFTAMHPHIQQQHTPILGVTQADALFCLQKLAADMRWSLSHCTDLLSGQTMPCMDWVAGQQPHVWMLSPANNLA